MDYSYGVFDEFFGKADFDECLGKAGKWLAKDLEIGYLAELMVTLFLNEKLNFDEGLMELVLLALDEATLLFVLGSCETPMPTQFYFPHLRSPVRKYMLAQTLAEILWLAYDMDSRPFHQHGFSLSRSKSAIGHVKGTLSSDALRSGGAWGRWSRFRRPQ